MERGGADVGSGVCARKTVTCTLRAPLRKHLCGELVIRFREDSNPGSSRTKT